MTALPTIQVLDIPLFDGDIPTFYKILEKEINTGQKLNRQISFCDANVLVSAKQNSELKNILTKHTFLNMPDGMPGVWIGKLKRAKNIDRCYGPDVFEFIIRSTAKNNKIKHFFTGGKDGVAEELRNYCEVKLMNHNIVGVHCPPFRELSEIEIIDIADNINKLNVDIVWIGISSPKQDIYAKRLSQYLKVHYIFTIGAAFDFFTGYVKQAPKFIQRSGFEWLYRVFAEPKRMWKRYLKVVPLFLCYNLQSFLRLNQKITFK